ncbi:hypothetical protein [Burkholderia gladioli]|uniref:hypothetical protein n=1 Tax=Burkholderia gladioli TaxID=28095 RepID=UPI0016413414|nr:hypothetical protein [Burkholderia gladioli]
MIKTNGAQWKSFMADEAYWGEFYFEEEVITLNGDVVDELTFDPKNLKDTDKLEIDGGYVMDQANNSDKCYSLSYFFAKWKKKQNTVYMLVECAREKESAVREAIKKAGGKI